MSVTQNGVSFACSGLPICENTTIIALSKIIIILLVCLISVHLYQYVRTIIIENSLHRQCYRIRNITSYLLSQQPMFFPVNRTGKRSWSAEIIRVLV